MKAYPLIYSRTKNFDFVSDFLVRPKDLDWQAALKYVKNAMADLDFIQGIRYTVFGVGEYGICGGIACISAKLAEQVKGEYSGFLADYPDADAYLRDCKGRQVACFIGIAVSRREIGNGMIPCISLKDYWSIYLEYVKHQWQSTQSTSSEQLTVPPVTVAEKNYMDRGFQPEIERIGSHGVLKHYKGNEQKILDYFFHAVLSGRGESLITEIQSREEWDGMHFGTAVVSDKVYHALKANPMGGQLSGNRLLGGSQPKTGGMGEVQIKVAPRADYELERASSEKKTVFPCGLTVIIAVVLGLLIIWGMFRLI